MRCANCGSENADGTKFCRDCGTTLAQRCARCGAPNPPGSRFCGECGVRLDGVPVGIAKTSRDVNAGHDERAADDSDFGGGAEAGRVDGRSADSRSANAASADASVGGDATDLAYAADVAVAENIRVRGDTRVVIDARPEAAVNPPEGERKTVTALFADIKGSTELMEDLDPEEARALIDPALQLMIEAARRYDGYIVQSTGDGIFALFGAPVAREDHPQRALHAALRMQAGIKTYAAKLRAEGRVPIEIRVGINSGEVVVRSIQTGERTTEYTPIGHTTNLASRLQAIAPTGSVVLSGETMRLVTGFFELKSLGPVKVRGVSEPVEVYEAVGLGPLRTRLEASAMRGLTKFCGRSSELDRVKQALELVRAGHGQVLAAVGDAGVGKSRLFYEFKVVASNGCMVLEAFAVSHGKVSPYLPVIQLLDEYFGITEDDDSRRRREKVGGKVLMLDRALEDTLPYLFTLMGIQDGDDPFAQMDSQIRRRRTLEAIRRILLCESLNQPLIVILEDLHWIDGGTQELLDLLVDSVENARILLLFNYRPEYTHQWGGRGYCTGLELHPLAGECAEELLSALLGPPSENNGKGDSKSLKAADKSLASLRHIIVKVTDGNPFFIEEIVRALFEQGILERNGEVRIARPLTDAKIPPTVQGIIAARIDRLLPAQKELLQTVAVLGRKFPSSLAREVVSGSAEELERLLSELQAGDFIYEEPDPRDTRYTFKHMLTHEVAYGSILGERRRLLHERAAQAIETIFRGRLDDYLTELADHHERSGNASESVRYLALAAGQAARRLAYPEAIEHLRAGLKLLETLPESEARDRSEIEMLSALGEHIITIQGPGADEVRQVFDRACALCEHVGDVEKFFWIAYGLQFHYILRLELTTARELGVRQLAIAERVQNPAMLAGAYVAQSQTLRWMGEFPAAYEYIEHAIALPAEFRGFPLRFGDPRPMILSYAASLLFALGHPTRATERNREALEVARRAGPYSLAVALINSGYLQLQMRNPAAALEISGRLATLAEEHGFSMWSAEAVALRGEAFVEQGRIEEGIAELLTGASAYETTGAVAGFWKITLARAQGLRGKPDEGLAVIAELKQQTERTGLRLSEAALYSVEGGLYLQRGDDEAAAEACFRKSIEVARRQSAKMFELRATMSLARLLVKRERREEARAMLAEIYGWFAEGFETAELKEAKPLLDELGA
jgi:class 3 adenylate cyclase/tetratricopeptide (TPR) repeat protein